MSPSLLQLPPSRFADSLRIVRRYVVVNGFDGALTTLGLLSGFAVGPEVPLKVVLHACLGAAIALGASGVTSAYLSESAESRRELGELEDAMITDLSGSQVARASKGAAWLVALANGIAPFTMAMLITLPLWLAENVPGLISPINIAIGWAFCCIFLLGAFLGQIGRSLWILSGIKAVLVALGTVGLIALVQS
jgi:predicted membrane protein (TIGR00267 family)